MGPSLKASTWSPSELRCAEVRLLFNTRSASVARRHRLHARIVDNREPPALMQHVAADLERRAARLRRRVQIERKRRALARLSEMHVHRAGVKRGDEFAVILIR